MNDTEAVGACLAGIGEGPNAIAAFAADRREFHRAHLRTRRADRSRTGAWLVDDHGTGRKKAGGGQENGGRLHDETLERQHRSPPWLASRMRPDRRAIATVLPSHHLACLTARRQLPRDAPSTHHRQEQAHPPERHRLNEEARGRLFDFLIPVLVTGIQPDQVLGLKERFPRRRRSAALISVTSTEMQPSEKFPTAPRIL